MYELEPGDRLWPYHTHHANEEWASCAAAPDAADGRGRARAEGGRRRRLPAGRTRRAPGLERHGRGDARPHALDAAGAGRRSSTWTAAELGAGTPTASGCFECAASRPTTGRARTTLAEGVLAGQRLADHESVHLVRALVGQDGLEVVHVADDGVLERDAVRAEDRARASSRPRSRRGRCPSSRGSRARGGACHRPSSVRDGARRAWRG